MKNSTFWWCVWNVLWIIFALYFGLGMAGAAHIFPYWYTHVANIIIYLIFVSVMAISSISVYVMFKVGKSK